MQRAWENWGRTVRSAPTARHHVGDEASLRRLVAEATARGRRLKVVGSGHSWSAVAQPDDWLLDVSAMSRPFEIERGERGWRARVQGGITLGALNQWLVSQGFSLSIMGSVTAQTVAGAISTGTHGSSLRHGSLSSAVEGLRLVTADGSVLALEAGDDRLAAARVSLGALGVISEVALRVEPTFLLEEVVTIRRWDAALTALPQESQAAEYIKYWWLPHTDWVLTAHYRRVHPSEGALPTVSEAARRADDLLNDYGFGAVLAAGNRWPQVIPSLNRLVRAAYFRPKRRIGRADQVLPLSMPPRHREAEVGIPAADAVAGLVALRDVVERGGFRVNFIAEARFVAPEDAWLSPADGRATCQIGAYIGHNPDADAFLRAADAALLPLEGRPHWGKESTLLGPDLLARFPRGARFRALAASLDPHGTLRNPFLDALLA